MEGEGSSGKGCARWNGTPLTSESKRERINPGCAAAFCGFVCMLGIVSLLGMALADGPTYYLKAIASLGWVKTPCVIRRVRVEERPEFGEPTWRIAISFSYVSEGKERTSDRYDWSDEAPAVFAGETEAGLWKIARRYQEGAASYCYVNPGAPGEAVLKRGLRWPRDPFIWYPYTLIGVSLLGFIVSMRQMRQQKGETMTEEPMVTVAVFEGEARAVAAAAKLESEEIACLVVKEGATGIPARYGSVLGNEVQVRAHDADRAREVLGLSGDQEED